MSLASHGTVKSADVIVNARVAADPTILEDTVRARVAAVCALHGAQAVFQSVQSFRPGRPTPTHRYAEAK